MSRPLNARLWWLWFLIGAAAAGEPLLGIGHVPIAVRNLDAASTDYRTLGFTLKPGHLHDDSVVNNHAKFADGTELELITASEPRDALAADYLRMLASGEGPAYLALQWSDARSFRAALKRAGIGFHEGAFFTLDDSRLDYLFFGGDNRSPTDRPEHFIHANTSGPLIGVWIADIENPELMKLLRAVGARFRQLDVQVPALQKATVAELTNGSITLLPRSQRLLADRPIIGALLRTRDLSAVENIVKRRQITGARTIDGPGYRSLMLPPQATHGLWLEFRQSGL